MSDKQTESQTEIESHGSKHMLLMILCCFLPMIAIVFIAFLFPNTPYLGFLFLFICPLAMGLMMLPNFLSKKKTKGSCH